MACAPPAIAVAWRTEMKLYFGFRAALIWNCKIKRRAGEKKTMSMEHSNITGLQFVKLAGKTALVSSGFLAGCAMLHDNAHKLLRL